MLTALAEAITASYQKKRNCLGHAIFTLKKTSKLYLTVIQKKFFCSFRELLEQTICIAI
jgi:hypothetical protein